ncbi:MAG: UDP-3-O-(3-hydroxymyristoyl)glucosamine N-acyltransferase [Bacteroidales bacterium]|nr:UDP-3-O-(3-hydroxymyristoyl)glucosamine N-acyltransferase [Bacteroidales bacterium]
MIFSAKQVAEILNGTVDGSEEVSVETLAKIEEGTEGAITFFANPKYAPFVYTTQASVIIVSKEFKLEKPIKATLIRVDDPYSAFASLLNFYYSQKTARIGISEKASIHQGAKIGKDVYIGDFVVVEKGAVIGDRAKIYPQCYIGSDCKVGEDSTLFANVKVYEDCKIGSSCTIHSGVVIGCDGFGFAPQQDHQFKKIAQIGNVVIEDCVEIGANTTIDRATMGSTLIKRGVKLDNLIQVAHNVMIDENTAIAAQTGIAGSTKIGKNCLIGGQVGFVGHLKIGDSVQVAAQSGIMKDTESYETLFGSPAMQAREYKKSLVYQRNLDKYIKRIDELEKQLKALQK